MLIFILFVCILFIDLVFLKFNIKFVSDCDIESEPSISTTSFTNYNVIISY